VQVSGRPAIFAIVDHEKYETAVPSMLKAAELARANREELVLRLGPVFARREVRPQAGKYIDGLTSDIPRKNGWTIAEHAGDRTPDKTQRLLNHAVWDEQEAMAVVRDFVVEHLAGPDAVAVLDETGQEATSPAVPDPANTLPVPSPSLPSPKLQRGAVSSS
jgi:hypothetical protein